MAHALIVGMTESGKTTLGVRLAHRWKAAGFAVLVLDPQRDPRWPATRLYTNAERFLDVVQRSERCAVFLDESGATIGQYNTAMFWLATQARHAGHSVHFLTQRPAQLHPTVREQASRLFAFQVSGASAKVLAEEFNRPELVELLPRLRKGEYVTVPRFGELRRAVLDGFEPTPGTGGQGPGLTGPEEQV